MLVRATGSSPLARGTLGARLARAPPRRFIPARAGNTSATASGPRSCSGSSPLARGTREAMAARVEKRRFIPARAGNTGGAAACGRWSTVHPRSRGEHLDAWWSDPITDGSSPLARGTPEIVPLHPRPVRFIPARAGNTSRRSSSRVITPVHPRSRGEHVTMATTDNNWTGSSPLARGTRPSGRRGRGFGRFIPARAGNTPAAPPHPTPLPVHPRSRGEHGTSSDSTISYCGSSPLARGTLRPPAERRGPDRFIPARAGNTPIRAAAGRGRTVHPRSRGEHSPTPGSAHAWTGSSPLARGTLFPELIDRSNFFRC